MRERLGLQYAVGVVFLLTAALLRGQCNTAVAVVSQPATFPNLVAGPTATNGSIVGVAKTDTTSGVPAVWFATYDSNLNQLTADRLVASATFNGAVALFWNGSEFTLFFQAPSLPLQFQRIDPSGNLIGLPISIANHAWSPDDIFDVTWVPGRNAYAVARTITQGPERGWLWLTAVSPSGAVLLDTQVSLFFAPRTPPRVFGLPDGTLGVIWAGPSDTSTITIALISASGTMQTTQVSLRNVTAATAASDGRTILVIFSSSTSAGGTELRYAQYDTSLSRITADSSYLAGTGTDIVLSQLVWNPALSEWVLTYIDAPLGISSFAREMRIRRFTSVSATPSDSPLSPDPIHSRLVAPYPIVFLNGAYIASIQRVISRFEGSESYLVKVCPFFVTATADRPFTRPFVPVTFTASASGGKPGYTYEWQFGDNDSARGTVVQHLYPVPGTYTVTLTGTDAFGAVAITKTTVQITLVARQRAVRH